MEFKILNSQNYIEYIEDIATLFKKSFKKEISLDYLKWRYIDNPVDDTLACIALDHGKVVANYSASPCSFDMNGPVKAALSMTTMTDPDYAGKGLFTQLANILYSDMKEKGYAFIFGFPNHLSHRGFITKLEWHDVYEIPTMVLDLTNQKKKIQTAEQNFVKRDDKFAFNYNIRKNGIYQSKDQKYLKWRYANNPVNTYKNLVFVNQDDEVESYCIYKYYLNQLDILEFHGKDPAQAEILLKELINRALDDQITAINTWSSTSQFTHVLFEKYGFINREPITYFGARVIGEEVNQDKIKCYSNWSIQMGDSDVY